MGRLLASTSIDRWDTPPVPDSDKGTDTMDTIFDIWLADRRLHRRARTVIRRPSADVVRIDAPAA